MSSKIFLLVLAAGFASFGTCVPSPTKMDSDANGPGNTRDTMPTDWSHRFLPKLHVHLLQRLKDLTISEENGEITGSIRTASHDSEVSNPKENMTEEFINIGKAKIRKSKVTGVGDIDRNGYPDYIVASPNAKKNAGSIRLYLMGENDQFLFSRELVPGSWGFNGPALKGGDRFGSAVFKFPRGSKDSACIVAVGAPGDNANDARKGAVYVLKISDRGTVTEASKISADSEASLAKQHDDDEGFGSEIKAIGDLNGDGEFELSVKSLAGSTTMLFMNSTGEVKAALKVHSGENGELMGLVKTAGPKLGSKVATFELESMTIRAGISGHCFFNETSCACGMKSAEKGSASCLDVVGTESGTGKTLCKARDCEASYACSCDGTEVCSRVETTKTVYAADGAAGDGKVYCSKVDVRMTKNVVQVGVAVPTPEVAPELTPFNSTHCRCSAKRDIQGASECLDYLRVVPDVAVLCRARKCLLREDDYACDGLGGGYCAREFVQSERYVNDGDTGDVGVQYCHQDSHTVEKLTRLF